jgi:hypothetical protein
MDLFELGSLFCKSEYGKIRREKEIEKRTKGNEESNRETTFELRAMREVSAIQY